MAGVLSFVMASLTSKQLPSIQTFNLLRSVASNQQFYAEVECTGDVVCVMQFYLDTFRTYPRWKKIDLTLDLPLHAGFHPEIFIWGGRGCDTFTYIAF